MGEIPGGRPGENLRSKVAPSPEEIALIRDQLDKILASPSFVNSARMRQFLRLVVERTLAGRRDSLKESVIGTEVFERSPDYDPSVEPVVRVEARRLRAKLQEYYEGEGIHDPVVISLPKGGYAPAFEFRPGAPVAPPAAPPVALPAPPPPARHGRWIAGIAAVLTGAAALLVWVALKPASKMSSQPITSIAVLPFTNLSGDPAQDYLSDGMTEELIGRLAKIASLRVISRTSVMQYKGVRKPLPVIARELNVDGIVEGTFTRSGTEIRITAQLIDGKRDRHLWAEDYRRPVDDILAVQGLVARMIASGIQLTLTRGEESKLAHQSSVTPEAYDAYLEGRYFWNKRTESGLLKAVDYFKQSAAASPHYAPAYGGLADSYLLLGEFQFQDRQEAFSKARIAVDKALELDHDFGEARASRAALLADSGTWYEAEAEYHQALQLSPGYATAHQWFAEGLANQGRTEEALVEINRARELDPLSLPVNVQVGYILFLARRFDESIAQFRKVLEMDPNFLLAHGDLGLAYEHQGMYVEAIAEHKKVVEQTDQPPERVAWLAQAYAMAGQRVEARRIQAKLEQPYREGHLPADVMAAVDVALGDRDRALGRLEQACSAHTPDRHAAMPMFDSLRTDPRMAAALACAPGH
jgi:TolB-like protein/tetratricopeptide (TPR) repeat protein